MSLSVILCYHKVGTESEEGRRLNIGPVRLASHVRFFVRRSWPVLLARDLTGTWPSRSVCFTFDDAYESALQNGAAALETYGVHGTFYAVSDLVGKSSSWDGELARPLANWQVLRQAQSEGHEIGNHTRTHPHLNALSRQEQLQQVAQAHQRLRAEGIESASFCYPYGSVGDPHVVREAGYGVGMALLKRVAVDSDDRLQLPRIVVAYSDALPMLLYKIHVRPKLRRR